MLLCLSVVLCCLAFLSEHLIDDLSHIYAHTHHTHSKSQRVQIEGMYFTGLGSFLLFSFILFLYTFY